MPRSRKCWKIIVLITRHLFKKIPVSNLEVCMYVCVCVCVWLCCGQAHWKHMPIYHYVLSMDMHIGSICQFIIMSCQWTCTEKNVPDPIPDPFTWLSLKRIFMERAIGNNIKMQQRVSRLFPTGSLCADKEGWFWRVFSQDSTPVFRDSISHIIQYFLQV